MDMGSSNGLTEAHMKVNLSIIIFMGEVCMSGLIIVDLMENG
jgi:hypothetical protein